MPWRGFLLRVGVHTCVFGSSASSRWCSRTANGASPSRSAPTEGMSRYETNLHEAQKQLHKHRIKKAKKILKRHRAQQE